MRQIFVRGVLIPLGLTIFCSTATKEVGVIKVQTMDGVNAGNVNILPKFLQTFPPTELKKRFDSGKYTAIVRYMKHVGSETLRFPILVDIRYD